MSLEINIYRHGKSKKNDENKANMVAGRSTEAPLINEGVAQAEALGRFLASERRDIIAAYTSPAVRARSTGRIALDRVGLEHLELYEHDQLQEISQGHWEGKDRTQPLLTADGTLQHYTHPRTRGMDGRVSGGESVREVGERMRSALMGIGHEHAELEDRGNVAVFGHDFAIRCLAVVLTDDFERLQKRIPYCSETRIRYENAELLLEYAGEPTING